MTRAPHTSWTWLLLPVALIAASPAVAQEGSEQLEQIEPGLGEWQAEYYGAFGGSGDQGAELLLGVSDTLALGVEVELERPRRRLRFDTVSPLLLYRAIDPDKHPIGVGLMLQASIGRDGRFAGAEARVIVERRTKGWWLQGDLILRNARDDGANGTGLAYAASAQRSLGGDAWLGVEVSGQAARLDGEAALAPAGRYYAGPSLTAELPVGEAAVELGLAWLQRFRGGGAGSGPRVFAQFAF